MPRFPLLLFDFDGTLCATLDAIVYTFQKTFRSLGYPPPSPAQIKEVLAAGGNLPQILPLLHPKLQQPQHAHELPEWVLHYRHLYDTEGGKRTTLFAGAQELLTQCKDHGIACGILSNKGQRGIEDALTHFGLTPYFELVIGDNPDRPLKKKPDPMAYHQVIKVRFPALAPEQILMVGDTSADLEFARNAGLSSCFAAYGYGDQQACQALQPDFTISALPDLLKIVLPNQ